MGCRLKIESLQLWEAQKHKMQLSVSQNFWVFLNYQVLQKLNFLVKENYSWDHSDPKMFLLAFNGIKSAMQNYFDFPWLFFKISTFHDSE